MWCTRWGMSCGAAVALLIWLGLVIVLGGCGLFVRPPGAAPLPILLAVVVPLLVFLLGYWRYPPLRAFVLAANLPFVTAVQAWRFVGLGFLALYAYGVLPGSFAWPAGLGDLAIAVTAPWMVRELTRRPAFAGSRVFAAWNFLGILDLLLAIGSGVLSSGLLATGGEITTAPMSQWPLVLIPAYLVPLCVMLHLVALANQQNSSAHL